MATPDNIPPVRPDLPPVPLGDLPGPDDRDTPEKRVPDDVEVPDDGEPDTDRGGTKPEFEDESVPAERDDEDNPDSPNPSPMNPAFP